MANKKIESEAEYHVVLSRITEMLCQIKTGSPNAAELESLMSRAEEYKYQFWDDLLNPTQKQDQ